MRAPSQIDASWSIDLVEAAAISLARALKADRLLMDDRDGRQIAERHGLQVAGTLAVLQDAALEGLIDLRRAIDRLRQTTFRASPSLYQQLMRDYERRTTRE